MQDIRLVDMTPDRAAHDELVAAQKDCEALRQQYREARAYPGLIYVPHALKYALACDNVAILTERYTALVEDAWETERLREKLSELAV